MEITVFLVLMLVAAVGGFLTPFFQEAGLARRVILAVVFCSMITATALWILVLGVASNWMAYSVMGAGLCFSYIVFTILKMIGLPFSEAWNDRIGLHSKEEIK